MQSIPLWRAVVVLVTAASILAGCASDEAWVILSVRDGLSRAPVKEPVLTIEPAPSLLGKPSPTRKAVANAFGVARVKLATGQAKYTVRVDAPSHDLFEFDLPHLDGSFPSGKWLKGDNFRQYQLRPDNVLELMVTIEP